MKKVRIVTFHNELNYGAALQAYALQKAVQKEGGEAYFPTTTLSSFTQLKERRSFKKFINNHIAHMINRSKEKNFRRFRSNEFRTSKNEKEKSDIVICGSDQIWNPEITRGLQPHYFGIGQEYKKKASYAASCGDVSMLYDNIDLLKEYLLDFDLVSVREEKTCIYLNQQGVKCNTVVDPTLLLDIDEWIEIINKSKIKKFSEKYGFVYDLEGTQSFANVVNSVVDNTNTPIVTLRNRAHYQHEIKRFPQASPYDFLSLIHGSEYVVSNSFHALVFSCIFKKKAYIVPHTRYSERMISFLNQFNINLCDEPYTFVDFSKVDMVKIRDMIQKSKGFVKEIMEMQ